MRSWEFGEIKSRGELGRWRKGPSAYDPGEGARRHADGPREEAVRSAWLGGIGSAQLSSAQRP
jgi:hypothetical protein